MNLKHIPNKSIKNSFKLQNKYKDKEKSKKPDNKVFNMQAIHLLK
jgi:hypothetical protein